MSFAEPLTGIERHIVPRAHALASAWGKYNRAAEHHLELDKAAHLLLPLTNENGRIEVVRTSDRKLDLIARLPSVPERVACIVGDVVHCLRTALDHAAWTLARRNHYPGRAHTVFYPVFETASAFDKDRARLERLFSRDVTERLERLQPFRDRAGLLWLHDLDIVDKHEEIVIVNHRFHMVTVRIQDAKGERPLAATSGDPAPIDLQDGDRLFTLEHDGPLHNVALKVEVQNTLALQASPSRRWPQDRLDWIVRECFHHVEESLWDLQLLIDGED